MEENFNITLKNAYLFKRLLGEEENKAILQDLLECVLDIPHEEIEGIKGFLGVSPKSLFSFLGVIGVVFFLLSKKRKNTP